MNKCKTICKLCEHVIKLSNKNWECGEVTVKVEDCVNGTTKKINRSCSSVNDGNCKYYKENKEVVQLEKTIKKLEEVEKVIEGVWLSHTPLFSGHYLAYEVTHYLRTLINVMKKYGNCSISDDKDSIEMTKAKKKLGDLFK